MKPWPTKPCNDCPFTRGGIKLCPRRAEDILKGLAGGLHFHCHKHLKLPKGKRLGCAGANILALRENGLTQVPRLAAALGVLDYSALVVESNTATCDVFPSSEEMLAAHTKASHVDPA